MPFVYKKELEITALPGHAFAIVFAVKLYQEKFLSKKPKTTRTDNSAIKKQGKSFLYFVSLNELRCRIGKQQSAFCC